MAAAAVRAVGVGDERGLRPVLSRASCAVTVRVMAENLRNERAPVPWCDAVLRNWCEQ